MAKIAIISTGTFRQGIKNVFEGLGHQVDYLLDNSITYNQLMTYDLIVSTTQNSRKEVIKQCVNNGIPAIVAQGASSSVSLAKDLGMFDQNEHQVNDWNYLRPLKISLITQKIPKLGFAPYLKPSWCTSFPISSMAPGGEALCAIYHERDDFIICAHFKKGMVDKFGGTFGANCVFMSFLDREYLTRNAIKMLDNAINFCFQNYTTLSGKVVDETDQPISREVKIYDHKTGELVSELTSNEEGLFSAEVFSGQSYYVIAFDKDNGKKNAVIIDNIKV